jgi:hypothetical protein
VEAQDARALGQVFIVGCDRAAVAQAGQVLRGEERERGHVR